MDSSLLPQWVKALLPQFEKKINENDEKTEGERTKGENRGNDLKVLVLGVPDQDKVVQTCLLFVQRMHAHQSTYADPDSMYLKECQAFLWTPRSNATRVTCLSEVLVKLWEAQTKCQMGEKKRKQVLFKALYCLVTVVRILEASSEEQEIATFQVERIMDSATDFFSKSSLVGRTEREKKEEENARRKSEQLWLDEIDIPNQKGVARICIVFVQRMQRHSDLGKREDHNSKTTYFDECQQFLWTPLKITPQMTVLSELLVKLWETQDGSHVEERKRRQILIKVLYCVMTMLHISRWDDLACEEQELAMYQAKVLLSYVIAFFQDSSLANEKIEKPKEEKMKKE